MIQMPMKSMTADSDCKRHQDDGLLHFFTPHECRFGPTETMKINLLIYTEH